MELALSEKEYLLKMARMAIYSLFHEIALEKVDYNLYPNLNITTGAFVTLRKYGELRGCVGFINSDTKLIETIQEAAVSAAFHDTRFFPLGKEELNHITIEISVLSTPVEMKDYDEIIIGTHGLILQEVGQRALLLPQVPIEHKLNRDQFLSALCEKAGLYCDLWKIKKLDISLFTAEIFSEELIRSKENAN